MKLANVSASLPGKSDVPDILVDCRSTGTEEELVIVLVVDVALLVRHLTLVGSTITLSNVIDLRL